jgi:putative solute:sodium symporter small subunit
MRRGQGSPAGGSSRYWRRVQRITGVLLALWLLVTLVGPWFARDVDGLRCFGFPLSFWMASQGALLVYLAIIVVYALLMDRLDDEAQAEGLAAERKAGDD